MRKYFFVVGLILIVPSTASAYVDPGSGTLLWQMLTAAFFGCLFYIKRIIGFFKGNKK